MVSVLRVRRYCCILVKCSAASPIVFCSSVSRCRHCVVCVAKAWKCCPRIEICIYLIQYYCSSFRCCCPCCCIRVVEVFIGKLFYLPMFSLFSHSAPLLRVMYAACIISPHDNVITQYKFIPKICVYFPIMHSARAFFFPRELVYESQLAAGY